VSPAQSSRRLHKKTDGRSRGSAERDRPQALDRTVAVRPAGHDACAGAGGPGDPRRPPALEQQYDAEAGEERQPLSGEELDPDKLMRQVEDFLRKQREGGTGT